MTIFFALVFAFSHNTHTFIIPLPKAIWGNARAKILVEPRSIKELNAAELRELVKRVLRQRGEVEVKIGKVIKIFFKREEIDGEQFEEMRNEFAVQWTIRYGHHEAQMKTYIKDVVNWTREYVPTVTSETK